MPDPKTYILDDLPTDKDALDFEPYVETLVDVCKTASTPLTIGVFGTWGSGKTSLMHMVQKGLPKKYTVAWFDAWKYDKEETLWRAFLLSVLSAVRSKVKEGEPTDDLDYLGTMLYRAIDIEKAGGVTIDLGKLGGKVTQGVVQLGLSFIPGGSVLSEFVKKVQQLGAESLTDDITDAIQRERTKIHIEQVRFLEQFQDKFRTLVEQHVTNNGGRLIVFVDDLDRCLPEKAIEVLEAIKLFVDAPGCVFVLGLDQDVIARGIEMKYRKFEGKFDSKVELTFSLEGVRYLEKIIQLPFQIPPIERTDMSTFVIRLSKRWPHYDCARVFAEGLGNNPRQIKRTVNVFLMLWNLAQKRKDKLGNLVKPVRLAKVVAIQSIYPELYDLLKEEPRFLRNLEEFYRKEAEPYKREEKGSFSSWLEGPDDMEEDNEQEFDIQDSNLPEWLRDIESTATKASDVEDDQTKVFSNVELPPALDAYTGRFAVRRILTMHHYKHPDVNFVDLSTDELRLYFTLARSVESPKSDIVEETPRFSFEPQLVRIPTGEFLMGTSDEQSKVAIGNGVDHEWVKVEKPQHVVKLSEYLIGKYPITNREYREFIRDSKHETPQNWDADQYPEQQGDNPVTYISWDDAQAYCQWLSRKTSQHYRLPTEAEWEKAARGTEARVFPWGDDYDVNNANTIETGIGKLSSVGRFSPLGDSPYGCVDMAGNVWEWCADWFTEGEYETHLDEVQDPRGPDKGEKRVLRGGSYLSNRLGTRCACRIPSTPRTLRKDFGFRVVRSSIKIWDDQDDLPSFLRV